MYEESIYKESGEIWKKKGEPYDGHHLIQINHGGPNEWWNIHPAHGLTEHPKIHGVGSTAREIHNKPYQGGKK